MLPKDEDQQRVKKLLTEAVTLLCRSSLNFEDEVNVEGLLGITLDKKDIFLVSIRETLQHHMKAAMAAAEEGDEVSESDSDTKNSSKKKRKRKRRKRSRSDSSDDSDVSDGEDSSQKKSKSNSDEIVGSHSLPSSSGPTANVKQEMSYNVDEDDCVMYEPTSNMKQEAPSDMQMQMFPPSNIQWNPNDSNSSLCFDPNDTQFQMTNTTMNISSQSQGEQSKNWPCTLCDKVYSYKQTLQRHMKDAHEGVKHKCPVCHSLFSQRHVVKSHIMKQHPQHRFVCTDCSMIFYFAEDYDKHKANLHFAPGLLFPNATPKTVKNRSGEASTSSTDKSTLHGVHGQQQ